MLFLTSRKPLDASEVRVTKNLEHLTDVLVFEDYAPSAASTSGLDDEEASDTGPPLDLNNSTEPSESVYYTDRRSHARRPGKNTILTNYRDLISVGYDKVSHWVSNAGFI